MIDDSNDQKHNHGIPAPHQRFLLQCPLPWCRKGFNDVPQIQKHISMSAWCGLYLQKLLHAQSQTFGNPLPTICAPQTTTNINNLFAAAEVCFPIFHQEPDYWVAGKDGLITDEPPDAKSKTIADHSPIDTLKWRTSCSPSCCCSYLVQGGELQSILPGEDLPNQ